MEAPSSQASAVPELPELSTRWEVGEDACRSTPGRRSLSIPGADTPMSVKKRSPSMGHFISATKEKEVEVDTGWYARAKRFSILLVEGNYTSNFLAIVVVLDAYLTANDIDSRVDSGTPSPTITTLSDVCLILYTCEVPILLLARGTRIFTDWMVLTDLAIILCGYVELVLNIVIHANGSDEGVVSSIGLLRVLRLARIIRLMKLLRKNRNLKELQKLVTMLATCFKALLWSFLFCFVVMTVWAMLIVELVNPVLEDVVKKDPTVFQECAPQCLRATRSVMDANLLLFKTVIAGDSWGLIAVPVIQENPWTAIIFMGSLLTLVFGVLNMIVAVVVDTFAEVRESDVMNLAEELEHGLKKDRKFLHKVFTRLDKNGTGELTLDDLMEGARRDPEFQSRLRVMDIDEVDLQQLFEMIDADGSGAIEVEEFIAPLSRWVHESKTAPRFIKYNMMQSLQMQEDILRTTNYHFNQLSHRLDELSERLKIQTFEQSFEVPRTAGFNLEEELRRMSESPKSPDAETPLETVQEELAWVPDMVGLVEQPQKSESRPMFESPKMSPTASEDRREPSSRRSSRGPNPSKERHRGVLGAWDRVTHGHSLDEVQAAISTAMQAFEASFEQSLMVSTDRAMRVSMAKAEAALKEALGDFNSTSWNALSSFERPRSSSASATSTMSLFPANPPHFSRQSSGRRRSVTSRTSAEFRPSTRVSQRMNNGVGALWDGYG